MNTPRPRAILLVLLLAGLAGASHAALPPGRIDMRVTEELTTGSFDDPAGVPLHQTLLRLRLRGEGWRAQAELPWLRVVGAARAGLAPSVRTDEGVADLRLKLTMPLRAASRDTTGVDLVLKMNAGRGVTVGGVEPYDPGQAVRLALERPLGAWTAFGYLGLRREGDLPGVARGRHAFDGEVGAFRLLAPKVEAGAFLDLRQRMPESSARPEASLYAAMKDGDRRWRVFLSRQFGPNRSALAAGLGLRADF